MELYLYICTLIILCSLNSLHVYSNPIGLDQHVGVKGTIYCGGKPMEDVRVQLWERDLISRDDFLGETYTDENGFFQVEGVERELFRTQPYITIHPKCLEIRKENNNCYKTFRLEVGRKAISITSEKCYEVFDNIEMTKDYKDQKNVC
uniref:Transthyretin-like family protein n=1 Tax=Parastrongyloides trichosuri TaxID=131310 RepID=A0A0N5A132_PARTI